MAAEFHAAGRVDAAECAVRLERLLVEALGVDAILPLLLVEAGGVLVEASRVLCVLCCLVDELLLVLVEALFVRPRGVLAAHQLGLRACGGSKGRRGRRNHVAPALR